MEQAKYPEPCSSTISPAQCGQTASGLGRVSLSMIQQAILMLCIVLPLPAQWKSLGANTVLNNAKLNGSVLVDCAGATPPSYCTGTGANYTFASGAHEVVDAWGAAAADLVNNRWILTGGGHTDYNGNQVYVLDLNTNTMTIDHGPTSTLSASTAVGSMIARESIKLIVCVPHR